MFLSIGRRRNHRPTAIPVIEGELTGGAFGDEPLFAKRTNTNPIPTKRLWFLDVRDGLTIMCSITGQPRYK